MVSLVLAQLLALSSGACIEGTRARCSLAQCTTAYRECVYPGFGPCECFDEPTVQTVTTDGKYLIAAVWYAAPGADSTTVYSSQIVTGTTMSTKTSTEENFSVGVSAGADFLGVLGSSVGVTFDHQWSASSQRSIDSKLTYTTDNTMLGSGQDGIDHNRDEIVLLLKPEIKFKVYSLRGSITEVTWAIDASRATLYPVRVGWLNGMDAMPTNVMDTLRNWAGITEADYPQILAASPFAFDPGGLGSPAPEHYECIETLYYVPGLGGSVSFSIGNSYNSTVSTSTEHTYSVQLELSGTVLVGKFNATDKWTWSNGSSTSNYSGNSSTLSVNLAQPSAAYLGPTVLYVYVDKIYKTLMYSFIGPANPNAYCY